MLRVIPTALCGLVLTVCGAMAQTAAPPAAAGAQSTAAPKYVLVVGDQTFTEEQFEQLVAALPPQLQAAARGPQRREFALQIAELLAVAKEAERRKLDQNPEVAMRLRYQRDNVLAGALYQEMVASATVSDEALNAFYQENKAGFEEVTAKHILLRFQGSRVPQPEGKPELTEEQAKAKAEELKAKLVAGANFDELAKTESDDTGSAQTGGSLGTFGRGQMIPAFEEAAFTQPIGAVGEPIRTDFGYHLILVEKRQSKSLEEVRPQLEEELKPQAARAGLKSLTADMKVELDEAYFTAPATPEVQLEGGDLRGAPPAPQN